MLTDRKATKLIVVHCAATPPTADIGAKEIRKWHTDKGWQDIGYALVIRRSGTVEAGRPLDKVGSHVLGRNSDSIGVCLVGGIDAKGKSEVNYTPGQWAALRTTIKFLLAMYPGAQVTGHRDVIRPGDPPKDCPCFDVHKWWLAGMPVTGV